METWEFSEHAPGERIPYGQRSYYKPEPLPSTRELVTDEELSGTISDASFWLGKLSGLSEMVDYPPLLYTSLVRKEAIESAEIEGADVDMDDNVVSASEPPNGLVAAVRGLLHRDEQAGVGDVEPAHVSSAVAVDVQLVESCS
ncbi:hypothetical protein EXE43_18265 [Halorubrum sp. SS5]|nr:hypothetical protein EXE44_11865 [Halorubrum sp. SS7]TKX84557.1 hypothetical protein EXE43_18265 [Halorubrum sp. SS5]